MFNAFATIGDTFKNIEDAIEQAHKQLNASVQTRSPIATSSAMDPKS